MSEELQAMADRVMKRMRKPKQDVASPEQQKLSCPLIPTGSIMLNLACSDTGSGGYGAGKIVNLIGDSSSGKTLLAFSMFAEMARDSRFDDYAFIYDDVEQACEFNIKGLFSEKVAERVIPPYTVQDGDGEALPKYSETVQEFHANVFEVIERGQPFVYVLDSLDALSSTDEQGRLEDQVQAVRQGKELKGSYRMEKPKLIGEILRTILSKLKSTKSMLLVISQTRDNIDPMSFEKRTRSGGKALRFYASHEIWLAVKGKIKSKERVIGSNIKAKVSKNKLTGKLREVEFSVYYDYGVDDLGACIDFLLEEGKWQKKGNTILTPMESLNGTRQKVIQNIEEQGEQEWLINRTEVAWQEIEESVRLNRKPKYE
jgi:recombination protein RecA